MRYEWGQVLQSARKPADKPTRRTAGKSNGGQALHLLTIALKPNSNRPMHERIL